MSAGGRGAAGASADYYAHRPDAEGHREYRPGFDAENDGLAKAEVYETIEGAEGEYAYRIVLSPGEEMGAEELREWARDVMEPVEEDGGEWIGFVHDDHTEHPHVHVIAFTEERLDRDDLAEMREIGTEGAELGALLRTELEMDPMAQDVGAGVAMDVESEYGRLAYREPESAPAEYQHEP